MRVYVCNLRVQYMSNCVHVRVVNQFEDVRVRGYEAERMRG